MPSFTGQTSPLWRVGYYHLTELTNARAGRAESLPRRAEELADLLTESGLKIAKVPGAVKYSKHGLHGYTFMACLEQSSASIHCYPEATHRSVTVNIETCRPEDEMQSAIDTVTWRLSQFYGARAMIRSRSGKGLYLQSKDVELGHGMKWLRDYAKRWEP